MTAQRHRQSSGGHSCRPVARVDAIGEVLPPKWRVLLVDDDPDYRRTVVAALEAAGFEVSFGWDEALLWGSRLAECRDNDLVLLNWRRTSRDDLLHLSRSCVQGRRPAVLFLTEGVSWADEDLAVGLVAADVIDKQRSMALLLRRIEGLLGPCVDPCGVWVSGASDRNASSPGLALKRGSCRAFWNGQPLDLSITEFHVVCALVTDDAHDISYREIYDIVQGPGFAAGQGDDGHRVAVRSLIKRIRKKFRHLDPAFDRIENYRGYGYRWRT